MVQFITDSSADLPKDLLEKYNIYIVPLSVQIEETQYLEGISITPPEFYQKMFSTDELPKTSQPSPSDFADLFTKLAEKEEEILCFTISSGLSGTYQSACLGKELSKTNVTIFDTLGGSLGHGLQILKAVELADKGWKLGDIIPVIEKIRDEMNILILLDTIENVVKGGRLSRFQGSIVKVLNIKVILEGINGKIEVLEKIRGNKRFFKRALNIIGERKADFSETVFGITHTGNFEDVEFLKTEIEKRYNPREIIINYMGATMGTYAGKGGTIISFY
ncbi:DegV family protein [Gracilibacillus boraciitolerans JCM 21714]|uniref:DegV family protein n=1 Tax=Gracilibacillus boraciitolerans JCM 21714 TaxID=1298598 RepID=W4VGF0_9BACI|nr:DegV family protein [Gracilibacillus boraciitolerans]GAE92287.1 DegV family protein [Gracilibacillus boraciitolerans JCM 21714]